MATLYPYGDAREAIQRYHATKSRGKRGFLLIHINGLVVLQATLDHTYFVTRAETGFGIVRKQAR